MMRSFLFLAAGLMLSACSASSDSTKTGATTVSPTAHVGAWQWVGSGTDRVTDSARYTLEFQPDGIVLVMADCNRGQGSYRIENGRLTIDRPGLTKMGCGDQSRDREFIESIISATALVPAGDQLQLELANGGRMEFARAGR